MTMTQEELDKLTELSEAFFSIYQCALIMEKDHHELKKEISNDRSPIHKAYYKGNLLSQFRVRKELVKMAERGSNPAQVLVKKFIEECTMDNLMKR